VEARLIGLQGAGKTTLLDALSEGKAGSGIASVKVHDSRVQKLSEIYKPKKTTLAEFRMREVAWPRGEGRKGEMERYIDGLQGANVFLHVVRAFDNPMMGEPVHAVDDLLELDQSFLVSDLMIVERIESRARKQPLSEVGKRVIATCKEALEGETPLRELSFDSAEMAELKGYGFASMVPQVIVVNTESGSEPNLGDLRNVTRERQVVGLPFSDAAEVAELSAEEQLEFAEAMGLPGTAAEIVTKAVFEQMGLLSFFTVGEDEVRAWPVRRGSTARESAGAIHSDLERGFIRAETVAYDDFIDAGDMKTCRDRGTLRLEGKEYLVADGDILNIRFNV
jgi:ribosome-binding ATPase YchF (GTP1/OBG family)